MHTAHTKRSVAIVTINEKGEQTAEKIAEMEPDAVRIALHPSSAVGETNGIAAWMRTHCHEFTHIVFIGALGICVRALHACTLRGKQYDPAVVCIDTNARFVISVLSGHIGGANQFTESLAQRLHCTPVVTTQSDGAGLWSLDTLAAQFGWQTHTKGKAMNECIFNYVNGKPTALLLDIDHADADYLARTAAPHVRVFHRYDAIDFSQFALLIAVTPYLYDAPIRTLTLVPPMLHIGYGCRKDADPKGIAAYIVESLQRHRLNPQAVASIATIDLKKDEPSLRALQAQWTHAQTHIYTKEELADIPVPNPSDKVKEVTGVAGVCEAAAYRSSRGSRLILTKQKGKLSEGSDFTFAVAAEGLRDTDQGHIEIVGAGPGDPELISVRGKRMIEQADLVLYAGSLVPEELTRYAKKGATIRSSAGMHLQEQFELMKQFYDAGKFVVRLHTGDPCIYGAIEEQMALFDAHAMHYHITPGISSFQAAAAALRSQFTIPGKVQTIILTRGEGRTKMPEREQLHRLAQSQSTMCIYLSADIVEKVQEELLQAYPPSTPVAACYKLTWREERIYRGELKDLARIVRENDLTLTTLLVVGDAIDNREGTSRLYDSSFKHLFRP